MGKRDLFKLDRDGVKILFRMKAKDPKKLEVHASVGVWNTATETTPEEMAELHEWLGVWLEAAGIPPRMTALEEDMLSWAEQLETEGRGKGIGMHLAEEIRNRVFKAVKR